MMNYPLLLKKILIYGLGWAPDQKIYYRDQFQYTYRDLYARVLRLAGALQGAGVVSGSRVGVIEWDSHRYLEMYFGIPGSGATLHTINPRLAPADISYTVQHARDEIIIFHQDFLPLVEKLRPEWTSIKKWVILTETDEKPLTSFECQTYEEFLSSASPLTELPDFEEDTLATLSYTTGTTGKPKGVSFTHRQLTLHTLCDGLALSMLDEFGGVNKQDVYMPLTPLFHVHAWGMPFVATLLGLKQVYPGRYEPALILKLLQKYQVTFSHCVPTTLQMIITSPQAKHVDLRQWKVVVGGARLSKGLAQQAESLGIRVYAGYGLSETAPVLTIAMLKPYMKDWGSEQQLDVRLKTGFPIPLAELRVVDSNGVDVPANGQTRGEIWARTPWMVQGYENDSQASANLITDGWLRTGDVAYRDAHGYIQIVDRLNEMIKSGGEWISSLELENLLSMQPGVLEVAVIGLPHPTWGERPLAVIIPRPEAKESLTPQVLREHLTQYVQAGIITRWAIPEQYQFVEALPKTSVGKIDKRAIRAIYERDLIE